VTAPGCSPSLVAGAELMLLVGAWLLSSGLLLLVELATALVALARLLQVELRVLLLPTRSIPATHVVSAPGRCERGGRGEELAGTRKKVLKRGVKRLRLTDAPSTVCHRIFGLNHIMW
jgi:hypothetical protein